MASGSWSHDIGLKLYKNIRLDINKYQQFLANEYVRSARAQLSSWERSVEQVLSDPLNKSEWHKLRDPSRRFPYLNTGKQVDSIDVGVRMKSTAAGNFSITAWGEIRTPYSHFTSEGYKPRKDGIRPKWIGWMDDIFKGTRGFNSIEDIFELLTLERAGLR
jgi:hypothetical protein